MRIVLIILALVGYASAQESALKFETPINLGPPINTPGFNGGPSLSADGLTLYLASSRPDGVGRDDLWVSSRKSTRDAWQTPVNLAHRSTVQRATRRRVFQRTASSFISTARDSGGQGSGDIWVTTRASTSDASGTPRNLGPTINSSSADSVPNSRVMACRSSLRPPDREGLE